MKAELINRLTDSIESHKRLLEIFRTILLEDKLDGTNLFCYTNYKLIYEINKEFERIIDEYILLIAPPNKES